MKLLLVFFIAFTTPLVLFLATILYGDVTNEQLKNSLSKSGVYGQISAHLSSQDAEVSDSVLPIVSDRFTPEYIKGKTESALDDSTNWVTGKSQTVPIVHFRELKEDLSKRDPELLASLQKVPDKSELAENGITPEESEVYLQQVKQISDFTKNDFSVPLSQHLEGFKAIYRVLQIGIPVVIIIMLVSLFMIGKLSESLPTKFKWMGITFLVTAAVGYGIIFFNTLIAKGIAQFNLLDGSSFTALLTPIIAAVLNHFLKIYTAHQEILSTVCIITAGVFFVLTVLTRKLAVKTLKPLKIKRSYWEKPSPKK